MALSRSIPAASASLPAEKMQAMDQTVAQPTALSPQEAAKRVADVYAQAQARVRAAQAAARDTDSPAP